MMDLQWRQQRRSMLLVVGVVIDQTPQGLDGSFFGFGPFLKRSTCFGPFAEMIWK
jgi:hypothetical protein